MKNKDIKVLEKVCENIDKYEWGTLSTQNRYYFKIDYPIEAERKKVVYYSEVKKGLIITTGSYQVRFYYEEDNYLWETKYFASIIAHRNNVTSSIFFITNEDYEDLIADKNLFSISKSLERSLGIKRTNIVTSLYNDVNRKVSGAEDLYDEFLNDEE